MTVQCLLPGDSGYSGVMSPKLYNVMERGHVPAAFGRGRNLLDGRPTATAAVFPADPA